MIKAIKRKLYATRIAELHEEREWVYAAIPRNRKARTGQVSKLKARLATVTNELLRLEK